MNPEQPNASDSTPLLTQRELKWLGNTAYLRLRHVLRTWKAFHTLPPLVALRSSVASLPIVAIDTDAAPATADLATTARAAILVADYRQLPRLLRAGTPPHCFTTPDTLSDYYQCIEPCGALAQSIAVITPTTHPSVVELLRGPRARLTVAEPTLSGLEQYALLTIDVEAAHSAAAAIARALHPPTGAAAQTTEQHSTATPPSSLVPYLPLPANIPPPQPQIEQLIATFDQCLTETVHAHQRIGHDWYHILHRPGDEAQRREEHARYFQAIDAIIQGLVGMMPPPFHRVLAIETACLEQERAAASQLAGFLYVQGATMIGYLRWFEGAMTWLPLLRADLQTLKDAG
ncbi:MAG: hypothetical protein HY696_10140 [Deltaproteobacteria bacterium]|nr:hypothetical protein [Deltaproteobacteria bacterium]